MKLLKFGTKIVYLKNNQIHAALKKKKKKFNIVTICQLRAHISSLNIAFLVIFSGSVTHIQQHHIALNILLLLLRLFECSSPN